jgi:hypothetical protein
MIWIVLALVGGFLIGAGVIGSAWSRYGSPRKKKRLKRRIDPDKLSDT